ncbi:MAG: LCP family protein [Candidatus Pelethousia sp.]|nr:LCP family protein [Candidatus Pelethousia sp.]
MQKGKRILLILFAGVLALALALGAGVALYLRAMKSNPMQAFETPIPSPSSTIAPEASSMPMPSPTLSPEEELAQTADRDFMKNRVNILMLGWDQSPEREDEGSALYRDESNNFRSDVIMVLSVDFEAGDVHLISIPRDTMASIYNVTGRWKINAAFAKGGSVNGDGFHYAIETVQNLLGIPISHYAGVDMAGLKAVVDAMGGVDYDVDVRITLNGRVLETGFQHLDGQQVLDYCRARKGISTDVGRADRQQRMLFAILSQLKSRDQLKNLPKVYLSVQDKVHTDLNLEQIAALTLFAMDLDLEADLHRYTLEGEYISDTPYSGASYYVLDTDKLQAFVNDLFGIEIQPDYRFDYRYVEADKAAASGMAYVGFADYLATQVLNDPYASQQYGVSEAAEVVRSLAERNIPVDWSEEKAEKALQQPLDKLAIEAATQELANRLYAFCVAYNITQAQVSKQMVPAALYDLLPPGYAYYGS